MECSLDLQKVDLENGEYLPRLIRGTLSVDGMIAASMFSTEEGRVFICIWDIGVNHLNCLDFSHGRRIYAPALPESDSWKSLHIKAQSVHFDISEDCISLSMVAASSTTISRWTVTQSTVSYAETQSTQAIEAVLTSGEAVWSIERSRIVYRSYLLDAINSLPLESSDSKIHHTCLLIVDDMCLIAHSSSHTLTLWQSGNTKNHQTSYRHKQTSAHITALTSSGASCILGYSSGKIICLRVLSQPLSILEVNVIDLSTELRATCPSNVVLTHDFEAISIHIAPNTKQIAVLTTGSFSVLDDVSFKPKITLKLVSLLSENSFPLQIAFISSDHSSIRIIYSPSFAPAIFCFTLPSDVFLILNSHSRIRFKDDDQDVKSSDFISFFASLEAIASSTILNREHVSSPLSEKSKGALRANIVGEWEKPLTVNGKPVDLPVTFHSRINSSGYGKQEDVFAGKKKSERLKRSTSVIKRSSSSSVAEAKAAVGVRIRSYDLNCKPMTKHQKENEHMSLDVPYYNTAFNADGSMLVAATALSSVLTARLPMHRYKGGGIIYRGHDARILSASFSNDKSLVLSSSADGTVRVWKGRPDAPVVLISHCLHQPTGTDNILSSTIRKSHISSFPCQRNKPFGCAIKFSSFFFLDKFILTAVKNSIMLYNYHFDVSAKNDLKRQMTTGNYDRVFVCEHEGAQSITAVASINSVQSTLIFSSTSDKCVYITDASVGKVVSRLASPHERNIHCIALPAPSLYTQLGSEQYYAFATAAIDNAIAVWDIRSSSCVGRYTGHVNRREEVGSCLSPCMKFLATGSEDGTCRLIDLRMFKELVKLTGHRDVCSGVTFNPLFSQLVTCSFDGSLRFYSDPTSAVIPKECM